MTLCRKCGKLLVTPRPPARSIGMCQPCVTESNLQLIERLNQPELYKQTDIKLLPQQAYEQCIAWRINPRGLLITGKSGAGKTRIMWKAIENSIRNHTAPLSAFVFDCVAFGHELSRAYRRDEGESWLDQVAQADLVAFDDIGKQKFTERVESELFGVVERRMAAMKPILATSEEIGSGITSHLTTHRGPALIRRLRQCCDVVTV